jgi:response regulator RpfG family c-di-GMP phosphodiesterase
MEVALAEIHRCAGTQFDPTLAEAFFRIGPDRLGELIHSDPQPLDLFEIQPQLRCA